MAGNSLNKVMLIGNLGVDPDARYTGSGNPVTNLFLITDESYKDRNTGQTVEQSEAHNITIFGKLAEVASQYLRKGSKVYIEGRSKTEKWKDGQGNDQSKKVVVVDINGVMKMLDSRANSGDSGGSNASGGGEASGGYGPASGGHSASEGYAPESVGSVADAGLPGDPEDGDIPF